MPFKHRVIGSNPIRGITASKGYRMSKKFITMEECALKHNDILPNYIEAPDGWAVLIDRLCSAIKRKIGCVVFVKATQVKEKFGGLRFYFDFVILDDAPKELIDRAKVRVKRLLAAAENMSFHTCQACGLPGKLIKRDGWYVTVCNDH